MITWGFVAIVLAAYAATEDFHKTDTPAQQHHRYVKKCKNSDTFHALRNAYELMPDAGSSIPCNGKRVRR